MTRGTPSTVWTPARDALLEELYAVEFDLAVICDRLNNLPAPRQVSGETAVRRRVEKLGMHRSPEMLREIARKARAAPGSGRRGAPPAFRKAPQQPPKPRVVEQPPDDPGIRRYERARALIAQGKDPMAVASAVGIEPWRALGIKGEIRQERARG